MARVAKRRRPRKSTSAVWFLVERTAMKVFSRRHADVHLQVGVRPENPTCRHRAWGLGV